MINTLQPAQWAYWAHRLSGILLLLFLPLHLYVLSLAVVDTNGFNAVLQWSHQPLLKVLESLLVFALATHLMGGLRVLYLESRRWHPTQKSRLWILFAASLVIGIIYWSKL